MRDKREDREAAAVPPGEAPQEEEETEVVETWVKRASCPEEEPLLYSR